MKPADFALFQKLLSERCGLNLWPEKAYLLEARLARIVRERHLASLSDLAERLRADADVVIERQIVEAMMTHETFFFRDLTIFDQLRERILPLLIAARRGERKLSIWSAACSSGQEPYSIAMMLDGMARKLAGWSVRILATDLSTTILERAKAGVYTQFEVQRGLPVRLLMKHFTREPDGWTIEQRMRDMVEFRPFNLLREAAPFGRFDLILCRNVMIYFDAATRARVFAALHRRIAPDGALLLGATETVIGATRRFAPDRAATAFYRPVEDGTLASLRIASQA